VKKIGQAEKELIEYLRARKPELVSSLTEKQALDDQITKDLSASIKEFLSSNSY